MILVSRGPFQSVSARSSEAARDIGVESLQGFKSEFSGSQKSNFDKLIEVIQEPHLADERPSIKCNTSDL